MIHWLFHDESKQEQKVVKVYKDTLRKNWWFIYLPYPIIHGVAWTPGGKLTEHMYSCITLTHSAFNL